MQTISEIKTEPAFPIKGKKVGSNLRFEREGVGTLEYDFKDRQFYKVVSGKRLLVNHGQKFFVHVPYDEVSQAFEDKAYGKFIRKIQSAENRCSNVATLLDRINRYAHWEQYIVAGIYFTTYQAFAKPITELPKEVARFLSEYCSYGNRYVEINGMRIEEVVAKDADLLINLVSHVRRSWNVDIEVYHWLYKLVEDRNKWEVFKHIVADTATEIFDVSMGWQGNQRVEIRKSRGYGYGCEYKTAFDYFVRVERTEAYDFLQAIGTYADYRSMYRQMDFTEATGNDEVSERVSNAIEKYPKWLKSKHDLVARNFRDFNKKYDEALFRKLRKPELEYAWSKYCTVVPEVTAEIKTEGIALNHCVASYIEKVLRGECDVIFMRDRQMPEISLVTVEIRNGRMAHARGFNNGQISSEQASWLRTFCKSKGLIYDND